MIFSINIERLESMILFQKQKQGNPSLDWFAMDTRDGRMIVFILHYNNNDYVYRGFFNSREDVPANIRQFMTRDSAVNGVLPEQDLYIFPEVESRPQETDQEQTNDLPDLGIGRF